MTAEQKAAKAKHTEHIRLTAQKVKALPEVGTAAYPGLRRRRGGRDQEEDRSKSA
jgi:hypothetical protein